MEYNIYRLKGITAINYQLPLKQTFVKKVVEKNGEKKDMGYRRIAYIPGSDSVFLEDKKGDLKPETLWFEHGDIKARKDDVLLNTLMTVHPWYGKRYVLWSPELEDEQNLEELRFKAKARQLIDDADEGKMKAIALAIFGEEAMHWTEEKCELALRNEADVRPKELQDAMSDRDYESKFLSGLAYVHGIVSDNPGRTAVIWKDSKGVILKLAKGEKGVVELGRYLSNRTDESELVLQSIGERLDTMEAFVKPEDIKIAMSEKDKKIAELEAKLAEKDGQEDPVLINARKAYSEATGKEVPMNMKNNLEWLTAKAEESTKS